MAAKPYLNSSDLLDSIKRKIAFPAYQSTFTDDEILAMANEEMQIAQVPSVLLYHEAYYLYKTLVPLQNNVSRYSIPDRAIGMRLRDISYVDTSGNIVEMTRIDDGDKSLWQGTSGVSTSLGKFYLEGNDIVLLPTVQGAALGSLEFTFFLRPNQLVQITRAATIQSFSKDITINASKLVAGDSISITRNINAQSPDIKAFTIVTTTITSATIGTNTALTTSIPHGVDVGDIFTVSISENTGSTPSINGTWQATSTGVSTFTIPVATSVVGSNGNYALLQEVSLSSTALTALNLANAINNAYTSGVSAIASGAITELTYSDITLVVQSTTATANAILNDATKIWVNFNQLPATWQNPQSGITETLYTAGGLVDFLQTKPGHKIYTYDVELLSTQGNSGLFDVSSLTKYESTGTGQIATTIPIIVGDYICLANEAIIPYLPPDMHTVLAERTASKILQSLGDQAGIQVTEAKIAQMERSQGTLLDNRVENAPQKVINKSSMFRRGFGRRNW